MRLAATIVLLLLPLSGCGTDPTVVAGRVQAQFAVDTARFVRAWDAGDAGAAIAAFGGSLSPAARTELRRSLAPLRADLGRITLHGAGYVDPLTGDARCLAAAHHVFTAERGVAHLQLDYDRDLAVVGAVLTGCVTEAR